MKRFSRGKSWSVRITLPKDANANRPYAVNKALTVIATTLDAAQVATLAAYPDAVLYAIQHRGEGEVVIADEVYDDERCEGSF